MADSAHRPGQAGNEFKDQVDKIDARGHRWNAEDVHALSLANLDGEYATVLSASEVRDAI